MPKLKERTSMTCEQWHDADGNPCPPNTPGGRVCGSITVVGHVLPFDPELGGKLKHRLCLRCKTERDSVEIWTGTIKPKRIDTAKASEQSRLLFPSDYVD